MPPSAQRRRTRCRPRLAKPRMLNRPIAPMQRQANSRARSQVIRRRRIRCQVSRCRAAYRRPLPGPIWRRPRRRIHLHPRISPAPRPLRMLMPPHQQVRRPPPARSLRMTRGPAPRVPVPRVMPTAKMTGHRTEFPTRTHLNAGPGSAAKIRSAPLEASRPSRQTMSRRRRLAQRRRTRCRPRLAKPRMLNRPIAPMQRQANSRARSQVIRRRRIRCQVSRCRAAYRRPLPGPIWRRPRRRIHLHPRISPAPRPLRMLMPPHQQVRRPPPARSLRMTSGPAPRVPAPRMIPPAKMAEHRTEFPTRTHLNAGPGSAAKIRLAPPKASRPSRQTMSRQRRLRPKLHRRHPVMNHCVTRFWRTWTNWSIMLPWQPMSTKKPWMKCRPGWC